MEKRRHSIGRPRFGGSCPNCPPWIRHWSPWTPLCLQFLDSHAPLVPCVGWVNPRVLRVHAELCVGCIGFQLSVILQEMRSVWWQLASERVFRMAGHIVNSRRANLGVCQWTTYVFNSARKVDKEGWLKGFTGSEGWLKGFTILL